jgi:uncharacterized membrane protein
MTKNSFFYSSKQASSKFAKESKGERRVSINFCLVKRKKKVFFCFFSLSRRRKSISGTFWVDAAACSLFLSVARYSREFFAHNLVAVSQRPSDVSKLDRKIAHSAAAASLKKVCLLALWGHFWALSVLAFQSLERIYFHEKQKPETRQEENA